MILIPYLYKSCYHISKTQESDSTEHAIELSRVDVNPKLTQSHLCCF